MSGNEKREEKMREDRIGRGKRERRIEGGEVRERKERRGERTDDRG